MEHSYHLVWRDYFPNENNYEFCRKMEGINRGNGNYFIYYVCFQNIDNHTSIKVSSQSENTKILVHTCIFQHCTSIEDIYTGGCLSFSENGHIIIKKVYCKFCSSFATDHSAQTFNIKCLKCVVSLSSFSSCNGTGNYASVLRINSESQLTELNESYNACKYVTGFVLISSSSYKFSILSSNSATNARILHFTGGNIFFTENMIINNSETQQGIAFAEGSVNVTILKCSFVKNIGNSLFYVYFYSSGIASMTVEDCSLISNEARQTYFADQGMILNTENIGIVSFQVYLPALSDLDTLSPFSDYQITCRIILRSSLWIYFLFPIVIF